MHTPFEKYKRIEALLNMSNYRGIDLGILVSERLILIHNNGARALLLSLKKVAGFLLRILLNRFSRDKWDNSLNTIVVTQLSRNQHFLILTKPFQSIGNNDFTTLSATQESNKEERIIKIYDLESFDLRCFFRTLLYVIKIHRLLSEEALIKHLPRAERLDIFLSLFVQVLRVDLLVKALSYQSKMQVLITEYDRNFISAAIVGACKVLGILTVTMVHGMIGEYGYTPIVANYIFCWGNIQRTQLIEQGVDPDKVRIVGYPEVIDRSELKGASISPAGRFTIGLATNPSRDKIYMVILNQLCDLANVMENIDVIVKLHPSQSLANYTNHYGKFLLNSRINLVDSEVITNSEYFNRLDFLINYDSGLGLEAMMHNKLVIIPELNNGSQQYLVFKNFAKCGLFADTKGLERLLYKYMNDNHFVKTELLRQSRFLNTYFSSLGRDSEKMIQANLQAIKDLEY